MLNNYETPDYRDTIKFKGAFNRRPVSRDHLIFVELLEQTIDTDQNQVLRCQQIVLFNQMLFFMILHLLYLLVPMRLVKEMPLSYLASWSVVIICSIFVNAKQQQAKRFPINYAIWILESCSRVFLWVFIAEYFAVSQFLLVNLMFVSILSYLRFKSDQQDYYTELEALEKQGSVRILEQSVREDPSMIEDEDWKLVMHQGQAQQGALPPIEERKSSDLEQQQVGGNNGYRERGSGESMQSVQEEQELPDEQRSQMESQQHSQLLNQLNQQSSQAIKPDQANLQQLQGQAVEQQVMPRYPSIQRIMSFKRFAINYLFILLSPFILLVIFHFKVSQLLIVWIVNLLYLTMLWVHCYTYNSDRRLFMLNYNKENAFLLSSSLLDSDILLPYWLVAEVLHIRDRNAVRRTRISLN